LEDSGISATAVRGSRTGLTVGLMDTGQYARVQWDSQGSACTADPYFGLGCASSVAAGRIAHHFDLRGPAFAVDTACSSALVAVHLAARGLGCGETDLAIAAGVALNVHPDFQVQACSMSMLAPDGRCKTFDDSADGFAMGEGGGVVVLERLSDAVRNGHRVYALLRGSAVNQDGHSNGLTAPNRVAQAEVVTAALAAAGVTPDRVGYVEAHGSGTRLGDSIELSALHDVFGGRPAADPLWVGAVKTNLGHTLAAAGMAGFIKTVLVLRGRQLPPNLHLRQPTAALPADGTVRPLTEPRPFPAGAGSRLAGISSFGWSGTNAHVVLEEAPRPPASVPGRPWQVLALSAASTPALTAQSTRLAAALQVRPDLELADIAHTTQTGRTGLATRRALVCRDTADAIRRLTEENLATELAGVPAAGLDRPSVAFLLPGVGDQYPAMGRELYVTEPVFAETFDRCAELLAELCSVDLRDWLSADPEPAEQPRLLCPRGPAGSTSSTVDELARTELAHPLVFAVELALARLLEHWGIRPDLLIGYSLGEYTAACLAGVFTLPDAMRIIVRRAQLIAGTPPGAMLAIAAGEADTRDLLTGLGDVGAQLSIAAVNGPAMTVVGGHRRHLDPMRDLLARRGIAHQPLRTTHAFHSRLLEPVRDDLRALITSVHRAPTRVPIVSNVTGTWLTDEQAVDPDYWAEHLCRPVRFADGLGLLAGTGALVEVGPGTTLGTLARQNGVATSATAVLAAMPSALAPGSERETALGTLGALWERGVEVDWPNTHDGHRQLVDLPTYPFQRTRFWPEPGGSAVSSVDREPVRGGHWCYVPRWTRDTEIRIPEPDTGEPLLVLGDPFGIGRRLAERVRARGTHTIEVRPGPAYSDDGPVVTIDPAQPEHYRALLDRCLGTGTGPVRIVHAWSLRTPELAEGPEPAMRAAIRDGFDSLLLLMRALGERSADIRAHLLTVSAGGSDVLGGDLVAPERAIVHGFGLIVPAEYPRCRWSGVDLDPAALGRPAECAAQLLAELTAAGAPADRLAAWRRGHRWTCGWLPVPAGAASGWRPDGVYLITGGTRGLGLAVARHLVRTGVRRLAVVARTALPDRTEWAGLLAATGVGDQVRGTVADLLALEAAGAEVLPLTADAGVPDELRRAVRSARVHFGHLTGVVHCAGVPGEGVIQRKTREQAGAVLAPKVLAAAPLLELVSQRTPAAERIDQLVLFSSSVSVLGGLGESDYCAANTVLDACAGWAGAAGRVVSVAWGPWRHDAWQSTALATLPQVADSARRYRTDFGITDDAGPELLGGILAGAERCVLAIGQPLPEARAFWATLADLHTRSGASATSDGHPRPRLRTAFVAPRNELEGRVAAVWERFLGIDGIGVDDPFIDLGGNSLVGMAMVRVLEKELDMPVAPAALFQYPTVAELARWLSEDSTPGAARAGSRTRGEHRRTLRAGRRTVLASRDDERKREVT
jgi:acyl transferase domain-containing protein/acyl carrier protein